MLENKLYELIINHCMRMYKGMWIVLLRTIKKFFKLIVLKINIIIAWMLNELILKITVVSGVFSEWSLGIVYKSLHCGPSFIANIEFSIPIVFSGRGYVLVAKCQLCEKDAKIPIISIQRIQVFWQAFLWKSLCQPEQIDRARCGLQLWGSWMLWKSGT